MKKVNIKEIILGIFVIIFSFLLVFGLTYVYDYFEGNAGREFLIWSFGFIIILGGVLGGFLLIAHGADNDII